MTKKSVALIVGIVMMVIGVIAGFIANFALADISTFALVMFGAGVAAMAFWQKRDTSVSLWKSLLTVVFVGIGAFLLGAAGFAENTMTTIITSVFGFAAIIAGIITGIVTTKASSE